MLPCHVVKIIIKDTAQIFIILHKYFPWNIRVVYVEIWKKAIYNQANKPELEELSE